MIQATSGPMSMPANNRLVDERGQPQFGIFPSTVACINGADADYRTPMGTPVARWKRRFHYKQFQYFGIISERFLIGCALADTALLGLAFVYVFDIQTGQMHEHTWRSPLARSLHLSDSPLDGESRFQQHGIDIRLGYRLDQGVPVKTL